MTSSTRLRLSVLLVSGTLVLGAMWVLVEFDRQPTLDDAIAYSTRQMEISRNPLTTLATSEDESDWLRAAEVIGQSNDADVASLIRLARGDNERVSELAVELLGDVSPNNRDVLLFLESLAADVTRSSSLRARAVWSIGAAGNAEGALSALRGIAHEYKELRPWTVAAASRRGLSASDDLIQLMIQGRSEPDHQQLQLRTMQLVEQMNEQNRKSGWSSRNGLAVRVVVDKSIYCTGQQLTIRIEIMNISTEPIAGLWNDCFQVRLHSENGSRVPFTPRSMPGYRPRPEPIQYTVLKPLERLTISDVIEVRRNPGQTVESPDLVLSTDGAETAIGAGQFNVSCHLACGPDRQKEVEQFHHARQWHGEVTSGDVGVSIQLCSDVH